MTVNAVVKDQKGRVVLDLTRADFEVIDSGERRPITDFRADRSPISVALLFDVSGSMEVAAKLAEARQAAGHVMAWLQAGRDEIGAYAFDSELHLLHPFAVYRDDVSIERSLSGIAGFGMTSLHDAIVATARELARRPNSHRAVVVLTDGVDNNSRLSAPQVSGIASAIDVPVYMLAVVSPLDHAGAASAVRSARPVPIGDLADLARWTGGEFFVSSSQAETSVAARQIVDELRHQYVIAFEPSNRPGWHPIEVRSRVRRLAVRARSGYVVGQPRSDEPLQWPASQGVEAVVVRQ